VRHDGRQALGDGVWRQSVVSGYTRASASVSLGERRVGYGLRNGQAWSMECLVRYVCMLGGGDSSRGMTGELLDVVATVGLLPSDADAARAVHDEGWAVVGQERGEMEGGAVVGRCRSRGRAHGPHTDEAGSRGRGRALHGLAAWGWAADEAPGGLRLGEVGELGLSIFFPFFFSFLTILN
jgi:hypothetical protein